jgi:hypothetical protein
VRVSPCPLHWSEAVRRRPELSACRSRLLRTGANRWIPLYHVGFLFAVSAVDTFALFRPGDRKEKHAIGLGFNIVGDVVLQREQAARGHFDLCTFNVNVNLA